MLGAWVYLFIRSADDHQDSDFVHSRGNGKSCPQRDHGLEGKQVA